ncbi:hypothetical protein OHQ89_12395 [Streptomyces canus]|uniref:hypothetical protein n=1 Tax=Streptomyces canus TaxID=58343 RepID=UPI0030DF4495
MTTFTDDFNRADSTSLGANWVEVSGDWSIISNQLSSGSAGGTIILRATGAMATNDNSAQVKIAATAAVSHGVWCRGNSTITQGYLWRNDGTSWNLFSVVGGSFVSVGSFAGAAVAGDVAKIQAVGSTITGYVNGVARVTVTNTAVTTGTSVGLRAESVAVLRFDDFAAADVTSGTTGDAALSGTATLTADGAVATTGGAALTATASLTTTGQRTAAGDSALTTTANLTAAGQYGATGTADLVGATVLDATGLVGHLGQAALAATAALAADGVRTAQGDADLAATADLTAQGQIAHSGTAALTATAVLTADGTTGIPPVTGSAALNATDTLTAAGQRATTAGAALAATAALTASGDTAATGAAGLAVSAVLTAAGTTLTSRDDVDVTVGAPYSPWAASPPRSDRWTAGVLIEDWGVGAPW